MVALSLLLHAPLTPLAGLIGLLGFDATPADETPAAPVTSIPIDLLEETEQAGAAPSPPPAAGATAQVTAAEPPPKPKPVAKKQDPISDLDGGVDAGAPPDAGDAGDAAAAESDAGVGDAGAAPGVGAGDPVALRGAAARIADPNANVRLLVYTERIRNHPLGGQVSQLLSAIQQWRDFFGPSGIDPVRDIDRIYVVGPQLRDSSDVVAILRYGTTDEQIRSAIDALVQRGAPDSAWLDAPVPAARAKADRAERIFVMASPHHVVVTPPSALKSALKLPRNLSIPPPKGDEVASAHITTPWRALMGLPFRMPRTIKWARIRVVPSTDGGASVFIEMADENDEAAETNARELENLVRSATQIGFGPFGLKLAERIAFTSEGDKISGEIAITAQQLRRALALAAGMAQSASGRRALPSAPTTATGEPQLPPGGPTPPPAGIPR
jgi:hypothetical protein